VGFKPTFSADERPQTYTLDRAATGTDVLELRFQILPFLYQSVNVTSNNVPTTKRGNKVRAESQSWYLGGSVVLIVVKTLNFSQC
jgi:hypothetical protein